MKESKQRKPTTKSKSADKSKTKKDFLVVGLGASAGGVKALQEFFATMPPNSGMAFVVILHLDPHHESNLANIIQTQTQMPVVQVTKTEKVEPNRVYVIPPNQQLEMVDGVIRPNTAERPLGHRIAIDVFFRTLAEAYEKNAVCVVMSGTGSDGTLGLKRVKESNGFAIVQDPDDAEYDSMPRSAINTQLADWVLPVNQMPEKLLGFKESSERLHLTNGADAGKIAEEIHADESLREILTLLRVRTGHDFANYKTPTLIRRIARHLQIHELEDIPSYLELLRREPNEIHSLLKNLLINVTNFFRDKESFQALEAEVIANIFAGKTGKDTVRVWSCGCASGEEAYSLAMILSEYADRLADPPKFQVFASDVDDEAIAEAREHRYPESIEADVSPERLKRFFVKEGSQYRVRKELREAVLFAPHNVLRDPPFSRLDLVSCRNLLIYLNRDTQERVLQIFHFALASHGYLFLGSSESAESVATLFAPVDKKHRVYSRRVAPLAQNTLPMMPVVGRWEVRIPDKKDTARERAATLGEIHYKLLENYAPSSVLVNQDFDIVYLSGTAGKFLRFSGGEPSRNLLKAINPDLLPDLRAALFTAQREHKSSEFPNIRLTLGGEETIINLIVRAVDVEDEASDFLLVIFEEKNSPAVLKKTDEEIEKIVDKDEAMETVVRRLEEDLQRTKEHLRFTIEQHETTVEELKASNEELQAINEELRSASEELETSKEELQSVNEELTTVNHELKDKIDETGRVNSDLLNLMAATDIATIFLDKNLRIKRYTPPILDIFNVTQTDIGRPLEHFTHRLNYQNLAQDAGKVLRSLKPVEREVSDTDGNAYLARFVPYRTIDDRIDGVVLNFIEITERKKAEKLLQQSEDRLQKAVNIETVGVLFFNNDIEITDCNEAFVRMSGYTRQELQSSRFSWDAFTPDGFVEISRRAIEELNTTGTTTPYEKEYIRKDGTRFWAMFAAKRIGENEIVEFVTDITEQKRAEELAGESEERFRLFVTAASEVVYRMSADWSEMFSLRGKEFLADTDNPTETWLEKYIPDDDKKMVQQTIGKAIRDKKTFELEHRVIRADGSIGWTFSRAMPLLNEAGEIVEWFGAASDITERKEAGFALAESEKKYRTLFGSIDEGFCIFELQFDKKGNAVDWIYLEANPAFERQTGFKNPVGKRISYFQPNLERSWFEQFAEVARTGEAVRFVQYTEAMGIWYDVYAFRFGDDGDNRISLLFTDISERMRAEAKISESEERLRLATEAAEAYSWEFDVRSETYKFSHNAPKILGVPRKNLPRTVEDTFALVHPDDKLLLEQTLKKAVRTGEGFTLDFRTVTQRGKTVWLAVQSAVVKDERGKAARIVGIAQNITTRKHIEEALQIAEQRMRISIEAGELGTWEWHIPEERVYWNERHFKLFGMKPQNKAMKPEDFFYHVHPDDREWVGEQLNRAVERKVPFDAEFRAEIEKDGVRWMNGYGRVIETDNKGKATKMSGVMFDITERKRAEEALRQSREQLQMILESTKDYAIITFDLRGVVTRWNSGAERIFGYTEKEIVGQPGAVLFTPADRSLNIPEKEMKMAREKGRADDERWHVRKDGTRFYASGVMQPLKDGKLEGYVKIARDQTERMQAEASLRERETLQKLVAGQEDERRRIARDIHDHIGQQMTTLRLGLDKVRQMCADEAEICAEIDSVRQTAGHLDADVDFIAWELRPAALDELGLRVTLSNFVRDWSHHTKIEADFHASGLNKMRLDFETETNLYRIAQEALNNIYKYAAARMVSVLLERRGKDKIVLIVEDDGKGFNPEDRKNRQKGIGLSGMAERARILGGEFHIESKKGKGTTVFARVPFKQENDE